MRNKQNYIADTTAKSSESIVEFIWEILCCLLLSIGTCLILNVQFPFQSDLITILKHCVITIVIISLITRRWWILLASVAVSVIAALIWLSSANILSDFFKNAISFFLWWFDNLPKDSEWFTERNMGIVHLLIHIGVSLGFFAVLRITRRAWPTVLICITIIIVILNFGETSNNSVAAALYVAGILTLFAKEHFSGNRFLARDNRISVLGGRWAVVTVSGVLCICVAVGAFFMLPENTKNIRTRVFSDMTADLQTATNFYTNEQQEAIDITLYDLGLQYSPNYIGSNLKPIKSSVIAVTDSKEPLLVKVTSYDVYDGIKWKSGFKKNYRINGIWKDEEISLLSGPITEDEEWMDRIFKYTELKDVTITTTKKGNILGSVAQTIALTENTKTKNPILFNEKGELFSYFVLPKDYSYKLDYLEYPTNLEEPEQIFQMMLGASSSGNDPLYENKEFYDHYTALPKGYSKYAKKLVEELVPDAKGIYEVAQTISNYFSSENGFSYTALPGWIKRGENVVDKLLETKKGHCVYYATAMVTMARELGIPSRLAAGYKTVPAGKEKYQVVDTASPYCWVECYIRNIGWVSFDPSPNAKPIKLVSGKENENQKNPEQEIVDDDFVDDSEEEEEEETESSEGGEGEGLVIFVYRSKLLKWLSIIIITVLSYTLLRTLLSPLCYKMFLVRLRYRTREKQAEFYYRDILRLLSFLGYTVNRGETLNELLSRLDAPLDKELIDRLKTELYIIEQMHYNNGKPSRDDVLALCNLRLSLEKMARKNSNIFKYILVRRTLLPVVTFI